MHVQVAGEYAADRIMRSLDNSLMNDHPKPDRLQVAMVLHALADHTMIMTMPSFDRSDLYPHQDMENPYRPTETSIGRWFHAVASDLAGEEI